MRLRQLLGITLLAVVTMATASASQLSGVLVKNHENAGEITILATGTFTHTESRPSDNLILVDLAGVSLPILMPRSTPFSLRVCVPIAFRATARHLAKRWLGLR